MEVVVVDNKINNMVHVIDNRRRYLCSSACRLKKIAKENQFIQDVSDDYQKYYTYIKTLKLNQYNALKKLFEYLEKLKKTQNINKTLLLEGSLDQKILLKKMKEIKKDLDKITETYN